VEVIPDRRYCVYVLRNPKGIHYIGVTSDVARRLQQHQDSVSKWTRLRGPWGLEWASSPRSLSDARKLENLLKRQKGGQGLARLLELHGSEQPGSSSGS